MFELPGSIPAQPQLQGKRASQTATSIAATETTIIRHIACIGRAFEVLGIRRGPMADGLSKKASRGT